MPYKFVTIPIRDAGEAEAELNGFLRSHRILTVHREFVSSGEQSCWCLAVEYLDGDGPQAKHQSGGRPRIDYKEILSEPEFATFVRLRTWRKQQAETEGIPMYSVFTNAQLAAIVRLDEPSDTALSSIDGIGEARVGAVDAALDGPGRVFSCLRRRSVPLCTGIAILAAPARE